MSKDIPFFEMFTELQLLGELRVKLAGAVLTGACIDQSAMSMELRLQVKLALTEGEVQELQAAIRRAYGFHSVKIDAAQAAVFSGRGGAGGEEQSGRKGADGECHQGEARSYPGAEFENGHRHGAGEGLCL